MEVGCEDLSDPERLAALASSGLGAQADRRMEWFADRAAGPPSLTMHAFETANFGVGLDATGTAVLAYLRRDASGRWSMTWVNAGHPPPILLSPDGTTRLLEGHACWFGLPRGRITARRDQEISVPVGSVVVFYTDGVVERRGEDTDQRVTALRTALAAHVGSDPDGLVDAVMTELADSPGDDVVVMAARVT